MELSINNFLSQFGIYTGTYFYCLISGIVPFVNAEVFLIFVSSLVSKPLLLPVLLLATAGQMTSKALIYMSGKGILKLSYKRYEKKINETKEKMKKWESKIGIFIFLSAFTGFPPFYVTTIVIGTMNYNFFSFFIIGFTGRLLRFGLIILFPQLFR